MTKIVQTTGEQFDELLTFLQWNINFIRNEASNINTKQELRDRVISLCDSYDKVLEDNFWKDGTTLIAEINETLEGFHTIIRELENNNSEALMRSLLMCHIADMLYAKKEHKNLIEEWKGIVIKAEDPIEFPYLIIRVYAAVYQKEKINPEATDIQVRKRIHSILSKGFRCCWVRTENSSTYFELDGSENESTLIPIGGIIQNSESVKINNMDMITDEKFEELVKNAKTMTGMMISECYDEFNKMESIAKALVQEKIKGERKGLPGEYNYMHSIRVYEAVKKLHHWDDPDFELFLAALLHDIVEDGGVSFEELVALGFTGRTVKLIRLCTHDSSIENKTERWTLMIARLIEAKDDEAWYIKLCDLADNLTQSHGLSEENRKFMVEIKAPIMLRLTDWGGYGKAYHNHLETTLQDLYANISKDNEVKTFGITGNHLGRR